MINPDFTLFDANMFIQVRQLLGGVSPDSALPVIDVTVGEPRIAPPDILSHSLNEASANWQAYPKGLQISSFLTICIYILKIDFPHSQAILTMPAILCLSPAPESHCIF